MLIIKTEKVASKVKLNSRKPTSDELDKVINYLVDDYARFDNNLDKLEYSTELKLQFKEAQILEAIETKYGVLILIVELTDVLCKGEDGVTRRSLDKLVSQYLIEDGEVINGEDYDFLGHEIEN